MGVNWWFTGHFTEIQDSLEPLMIGRLRSHRGWVSVVEIAQFWTPYSISLIFYTCPHEFRGRTKIIQIYYRNVWQILAQQIKVHDINAEICLYLWQHESSSIKGPRVFNLLNHKFYSRLRRSSITALIASSVGLVHLSASCVYVHNTTLSWCPCCIAICDLLA